MSFLYHSAKGARLFVSTTAAIPAGGTGTTELDLISASTGASAKIDEFRTSKTGNLPYREASFIDSGLQFSLERDFFAGHTIGGTSGTGLSVLLNGGTFSAALYLKCANNATPAAGDPQYTFSNLVISGVPESLTIDGKIALSISSLINGPFTEPNY